MRLVHCTLRAHTKQYMQHILAGYTGGKASLKAWKDTACIFAPEVVWTLPFSLSVADAIKAHPMLAHLCLLLTEIQQILFACTSSPSLSYHPISLIPTLTEKQYLTLFLFFRPTTPSPLLITHESPSFLPWWAPSSETGCNNEHSVFNFQFPN